MWKCVRSKGTINPWLIFLLENTIHTQRSIRIFKQPTTIATIIIFIDIRIFSIILLLRM